VSTQLSPTLVICLSDGRGGMEHDALKLAGLLSDCCDIVLVCKNGAFIERLYNEGNYSFKCETISFLNKSFSLSMLLKMKNILTSHEIRNVIYFGASELKTLYFSFIGKDLNVIIRHGTTKSRPKRNWFHRLVYSCVNYHIAISKHLLANVRDIVPHGEKVKFELIYPSFSFAQYKNNPFDPGNKIKILHVGRIAHGKGHRDAILACAALYDNNFNFELFFIGDGEDEKYIDEIKNIVNHVPYKNSVRFCGYVVDVGRYMEYADIFLYPSYGEGFGNVFVEAMAYSLSAVTYDNTTFPEFRKMGFKFRLVEDRNADLLAAALLEAAKYIQSDKTEYSSNKALAAEMFNKNREKDAWCSIMQ